MNACSHPKLASWTDLFDGSHCHQCMGCGEQVIVPASTQPEDESGILVLSFGEKWRDRVQKREPRTFPYPIL